MDRRAVRRRERGARATETPTRSSRDRAIDGSLPTAGLAWSSRAMSRSRLAAEPGADAQNPAAGGAIVRADPSRRSGRSLCGGTADVVHVSLNGTHIDDLALELESGTRRGISKSPIPAGIVTPGDQRLELRSDTPFKFWYVRIAAPMSERIVMVASSYPRFAGDSVGSFMEPIAQGIAARGHEVHLVAPWHPKWNRPKVDRGVHFHLFHYAPVQA